MKKHLTIVTMVAILAAACSKSKNSEQSEIVQDQIPYKSQIDSLLSVYEQSGDFMGSVTLFGSGQIVYSNAIGFSDLETKRKLNPDTKFRIGSISKTFTAVLVLMAQEENKLSLDQTIDTYFPSVENAGNITISNLLNHRSGIHSFTRDKDFFSYHTRYISSDDMLNTISKYQSDFMPDSKSEYSNSNYFLLALILEKVYETTFENILTDKILTPLDLKNTYAGDTINLESNECYSYEYIDDWSKLPETNMSVAMGSGSIVSTSIDLTVFIDALFSGKLISAASLAKMKTIVDDHGMGLMRFSIGGREAYGHHGSIDGFKSTLMHFPDQGLSIALVSNGSNNNKEEVFMEVLKHYHQDKLIEISEAEVIRYVGTYTNPNDASDKLIFLNDGNILIHSIKGEFEEALIYKGSRRFLFEQLYAESMVFTFSVDGKQLTLHQGEYEGVFYKE